MLLLLLLLLVLLLLLLRLVCLLFCKSVSSMLGCVGVCVCGANSLSQIIRIFCRGGFKGDDLSLFLFSFSDDDDDNF